MMAVVSLVVLYACMFLFWGACLLIMWLAEAVPLYLLARREGHPRPWLSFLPYGNIYTLIRLGGAPVTLGGKVLFKKQKGAFLTYLAVSLFPLALYVLPIVCMIALMAGSIALMALAPEGISIVLFILAVLIWDMGVSLFVMSVNICNVLLVCARSLFTYRLLEALRPHKDNTLYACIYLAVEAFITTLIRPAVYWLLVIWLRKQDKKAESEASAPEEEAAERDAGEADAAQQAETADEGEEAGADEQAEEQTEA